LKHGLIALGASLLLSACATAPHSPLPARDQMRNFDLEARFALRVTQAGQPPVSSAGRLSWRHKNGDNQLQIANPLGFTVAEIDTTPTLSRLRTADGQTRESADADALMEEVTGQRLPVTRMPAWLLGRSGGAAQIVNDERNRPARLREAGWQVDYGYEDEAGSALPARVTLSRDGEIELRLRIEEWKDNP